MRISGRKRKNFIQSLQSDRGVVYEHKEKERVIHEHFSNLFGAPAQRQLTLNWDALGV